MNGRVSEWKRERRGDKTGGISEQGRRMAHGRPGVATILQGYSGSSGRPGVY